jgi:hypothetical protein
MDSWNWSLGGAFDWGVVFHYVDDEAFRMGPFGQRLLAGKLGEALLLGGREMRKGIDSLVLEVLNRRAEAKTCQRENVAIMPQGWSSRRAAPSLPVWVDALHEKVREGDLVAEKQWDTGNPGAGAGSVRVYAFQALFFVDDDESGIDRAYETFSDAADDCMLLEVNEATVKIWVDSAL